MPRRSASAWPSPAISASVRATTKGPSETGGRDFALKLLDWHQHLPSSRPEAAVLRKGLVLDHHRRNAGRGIARHEISDVDRIAVAGIDIGDDRRVLHLSDRPHQLEMRVNRQDV